MLEYRRPMQPDLNGARPEESSTRQSMPLFGGIGLKLWVDPLSSLIVKVHVAGLVLWEEGDSGLAVAHYKLSPKFVAFACKS